MDEVGGVGSVEERVVFLDSNTFHSLFEPNAIVIISKATLTRPDGNHTNGDRVSRNDFLPSSPDDVPLAPLLRFSLSKL